MDSEQLEEVFSSLPLLLIVFEKGQLVVITDSMLGRCAFLSLQQVLHETRARK